MKYQNDIVMETSDGRQWIYDNKHHEWVDVTEPKKMRGKPRRILR